MPNNLFISGFLLINRELAEKFAAVKKQDPYLPRILFTNTTMSKITNAQATHELRAHGVSNYSAWRSIKFLAKMMRYSTSRVFKGAIIVMGILSVALIFAVLRAVF